jgi:epoxyqueuosine reductase QueG
MENLSDLVPESGETNREHLNNWIAVSVAILAAFMAVTKVKDDNIVQAMLQDKSDAVDTWNEYQSKRVKHHLLELGHDQATVMRTNAAPQSATVLDEQLKRYDDEIAHYTNDEKDLQAKARGFENQYDALNYRDDQFDLSDAALSVSLAMLAVTALTRKRWLLWFSMVFAAFGVAMGIAGLFGLPLHPNWLSKLLS